MQTKILLVTAAALALSDCHSPNHSNLDAANGAQVTEAGDNSPFSPSFDCSKVTSRVNKLICSDRELAKLDVSLSGEYKNAMSNASDKNALNAQQRLWLKNELNNCNDKACISQTYKARIDELGHGARADQGNSAFEALKGQMRHHARCLVATQFAPSLMESMTRGIPDGPKDLLYKEKMKNLANVHLQAIMDILNSAKGKPYSDQLGNYGDQIETETKNTVLEAKPEDRDTAALELANIGNSDECKD